MLKRDAAAAGSAAPIRVTPLRGYFFAEIEGIDLADPLMASAATEIRAALNAHGVLLFRGQRLTNEQHIAFSRHFGQLHIHTARHYLLPTDPEILVLANRGEAGTTPIENGGAYWHSDVTYQERPPMGSILYAIEVPPTGGDTEFADMCAAYRALPEMTKRRIDRLKAIHRYADRYRRMQDGGKRPDLPAEALAVTPDVIHPVVRTHPESGEKALFVNEGFTVGIAGMDESEGRALLADLFAHATRPEFVHAHKWRAGDVLFWDNRRTQHRATPYDTRHARALHRTTIEGDAPF